MELILSLKSQTVKSVKSLESVSNSYYRYLLAEWIHRVGENTSDIVARRILPRQVPVARHFNSGCPGRPGRRLGKPCFAVFVM